MWLGSPTILLTLIYYVCAFYQSLPQPTRLSQDDVIKWKYYPRYWPFVRGIHRWPVNSPHKGQWRGALILSFICAWINGWVNNAEASDLGRHRTRYVGFTVAMVDSAIRKYSTFCTIHMVQPSYNAVKWYCTLHCRSLGSISTKSLTPKTAIFQTVCTLHITFQLLCTLHIAPCSSSPDNDENAV